MGNVLNLLSRFEAGHHLTFFVDEELREVPLDVGLLLVVGIGLGEHLVEDGGYGVSLVPTSKAFLLRAERLC